MTLRVNQQKSTRDDYLHTLTEAGIGAKPCSDSEDGVVLNRPLDVATLAGVCRGRSQRAGQCAAARRCTSLAPQPGERILDACAAPGGKACHLLELQPALEELFAAGHQCSHACSGSLENSARLGTQAHSRLVADASALSDSAVGQARFDGILADVPVLGERRDKRRNPDIKILRQPDDIDGFARQQLAILQGLWPALAVDGRLLYVTCSLLQAENDDVIARVYRKQRQAQW